jgi:hypothetical protein
MSFQAYLDNIQAKTGKSPADFRKLATEKCFVQGGTLKPGVKAGAVVAWLKADFALGHVRARAIVALLKGKKGDSPAYSTPEGVRYTRGKMSRTATTRFQYSASQAYFRRISSGWSELKCSLMISAMSAACRSQTIPPATGLAS